MGTVQMPDSPFFGVRCQWCFRSKKTQVVRKSWRGQVSPSFAKALSFVL